MHTWMIFSLMAIAAVIVYYSLFKLLESTTPNSIVVENTRSTRDSRESREVKEVADKRETKSEGIKWLIPFSAGSLSIIAIFYLILLIVEKQPEPVPDTNHEILEQIRELRHDIEILKELLQIHSHDNHPQDTH